MEKNKNNNEVEGIKLKLDKNNEENFSYEHSNIKTSSLLSFFIFCKRKFIVCGIFIIFIILIIIFYLIKNIRNFINNHFYSNEINKIKAYNSNFPSKTPFNIDFITEAQNILLKGSINVSIPLKNYTTFNIGGPGKYFIIPQNEHELISILKLCNKHNLYFFILGNGSNILVSDEGIDGVVIRINNQTEFSKVKFKEEKDGQSIITAGAGILMHDLSLKIAKASLAGFEFAIDIPGTLGGSCIMNAGFDEDVAKRFVKAKILTKEGEIRTIYKKDAGFSFRESTFKKNGYIVLEASFSLEKRKSPDSILERMNRNTISRRKTQPLGLPSAGCFFKGNSIISLHQFFIKHNMLGYRVGDAMVSTKNANFLVNMGNATSSNVFHLQTIIRQIFYQTYNKELQREVILVGRFSE